MFAQTNEMNPVLALLLIGGGIYAFSKYKAGKGLQFYPSGFRFEAKKLYFVIEIVNPSFTQLKMNNLFAQVVDGDQEIGRTMVSDPVEIKPNGSTTIALPIKLNALGTFTTIVKLIRGELTSLTVKGTTNSEGISIPFEETLPVTIV